MRPPFQHRQEFVSYAERLAEEVIEGKYPIINYDYMDEVRAILERRGYLNSTCVVYHGSPSPDPHFTLNVRSEYRSGVEILDISKEQAWALNKGDIRVYEITDAYRKPLPTFVLLGGELVNINAD